MKILFLYSEVVGYLIPVFDEFVRTYKAEVHVVHWDKNKLKPYVPPKINGVKFYKRSENSFPDIRKLAFKLRPDIVYVSGWMDKGYLKTTSALKKQGIPVVVGFDDIWEGRLRQRLGSIVFPIFLKKHFSHAWVAGPYQFEFAKRLGFENKRIIFDLLSANTEKFTPQKRVEKKQKSFLYVGNFRSVKGTDILAEAYSFYRKELKGSWGLTCVGNGEMKDVLSANREIKIHPYANESELKEIASACDVFILPSRHDQWGVVVHEFCALGMPLILSDYVGASATFFIEGFNGYSYSNNSVSELARKMKLMEGCPPEKLKAMQESSKMLSKRITIKTSAANFISILK